jgi:hypothetical protein
MLLTAAAAADTAAAARGDLMQTGIIAPGTVLN